MDLEMKKMPKEDTVLLKSLLSRIVSKSDTEIITERMAARFYNLAEIFDADATALSSVPGLSEQGIASILCIGALFKRLRKEQYHSGKKESVKLENLKPFLLSYYVDKQHETVIVLAFNDKKKMIGMWEGAEGDTISSHANPSDIYRFAILKNATSVVVAHNHPGGNPNPSVSDYSFSSNLAAGLKRLKITLEGSFVVADDNIIEIKFDRK